MPSTNKVFLGKDLDVHIQKKDKIGCERVHKGTNMEEIDLIFFY